jgi:5-methylcytosine-specific restriction endonuclease McrA
VNLKKSNKRKSIRGRLRARYGDNCCWCAKPMLFGQVGIHPDMASFEHVVPKWAGGADEESNLMLAHLRCNHARNEEDQRRRKEAAEKERGTITAGDALSSGTRTVPLDKVPQMCDN